MKFQTPYVSWGPIKCFMSEIKLCNGKLRSCEPKIKCPQIYEYIVVNQIVKTQKALKLYLISVIICISNYGCRQGMSSHNLECTWLVSAISISYYNMQRFYWREKSVDTNKKLPV